MLNFLLLLSVFFITKTPILFAQNDSNYPYQEKNNYYNDYLGITDSYQLNYNYSSPSKRSYDEVEFNNQRDNYGNSFDYANQPEYVEKYKNDKSKLNNSNNNYDNSFDYSAQPKPVKKYKNFKDGKGYGYRVYDNSNRQSYFCNLAPLAKKNFTHDNNFNGIYFGVGLAKIDSSLDLQENENNIFKPSNINPPYKYNFSGSKVLPSIIIGQGRLFSSGLFLGQEYAINIGEFKITSNKIDNNKYKSISYLFSNNSYYSGKLGYNIFKNFLPYLKLSFSMSTSNFILKDNNNHNSITSGGGIFFGGGFGIDISIQNHLRAIIDYTQFYDEGERDSSYPADNLNTDFFIQKKTLFETSNSFTRFSLVYKF